MIDRPHQTDRLVEVGNVNAARSVDRQRERVIQGRIRGRPTVAGVARDSVPSNGGNDPVEIDLANALAEEVAEEQVAREVNGKAGDESQLRLAGGPTVADITAGLTAEWIRSWR